MYSVGIACQLAFLTILCNHLTGMYVLFLVEQVRNTQLSVVTMLMLAILN